MSIKKSLLLKTTKGFSLIEVLIFVTILSLFLITAAAIITATIRQNSLKVNMLKATHYNEELLEWIKSERDIDWNTFVSYGDSVGKTYCFTSEDISWSMASCSYDLAGMFKRYGIIKTIGSPVSQVEVTVYTEWQEGGNINSTNLHTIYTIWEE
jgi:type II secretory pathway pseudopilin PulG